MHDSSEALNNVRVQWESLRGKRPGELTFTKLGSADVTADDFDVLFKSWAETFETSSTHPRWLGGAQAAAWDRATSKRLIEIGGLITQAQNNGVAWLLQTEFLSKVAEVATTLAVASKRQANVAKAVSQAFEKKGVSEIQQIVEAGQVARALLENQPKLTDSMAALNSSLEEEKAAVNALKNAVSDFEALKRNVEQIGESASSRRGQIEQLYTEADAFRLESERKSEALTKKVEQLLAEVEAANASVKAAHDSVDRALVDVRRQGLAGAFSDRGGKVKGERRTWGLVFAGSIVNLAGLAIVFATDLPSFTYQALTVALLRRAAIAAPLIWVGWYSAKQIGRLSRIQEDYEYKAATALAFQSYRDEAEDANNDELKAELLRRAIGTFGDNPVRLYDEASRDPASPMSALIKNLKEDDGLKLVKTLRELLH